MRHIIHLGIRIVIAITATTTGARMTTCQITRIIIVVVVAVIVEACITSELFGQFCNH